MSGDMQHNNEQHEWAATRILRRKLAATCCRRRPYHHWLVAMTTIALVCPYFCLAGSNISNESSSQENMVSNSNHNTKASPSLLLQASRKAQEENDDDTFASCADGKEEHVCLHGGECVPFGDGYHCNCSNASHNTTQYVGKWCHLPPETFCGGGNQTTTFCVNGGTCKEDDTGCECPEDFVGKHCEYDLDDVTAIDQEEEENNDNTPPGNGDDSDGENNNTEPEYCPFKCQNGGVCDRDRGNSYICNCPDEFLGALCEESSSETKTTPCGPNGGDDVCHHGSTCIRLIDNNNNDGAYACDCSTANVDAAGRWCEFVATTYCDPGHEDFCVNGGTCRDEVSSSSSSCLCDETQWTGARCEYAVASTTDSEEEELALENCTLTCLNGGTCYKDLSTGREGNAGSLERCECPKGYTGTACEHEYQECGNEEHYCLHGSTCVAPDDLSQREWTCDCQASSPTAGSCQNRATTICTDESSMLGPYDPTQVAYCANDGVCVTVQENGRTRAGCRCPPGYTGAHCELYDRVRPSPQSNKNTEMAAILIVGFVIGVLLVFLVLVSVLRWRAMKQRKQKHVTETITAAHMQELSARQSAVMEEMEFDPDFDEGELEEVELL